MAVVKPGYWTHWKTQLLETLAGRPEAVLWPIKVWTFCEGQKRWVHPNLPDLAIDGICGFHDPENPRVNPAALLVSAGFIRKESNAVIVHEFEDYNSAMVHNWTVGKLGGRPRRKNPRDKQRVNPSETQTHERDNPRLTHREDRVDREEEEKFKKRISRCFGGVEFGPAGTGAMARLIDRRGVPSESELGLMEWFYAQKSSPPDGWPEQAKWRQKVPALLDNWEEDVGMWRNVRFEVTPDVGMAPAGALPAGANGWKTKGVS